jgi:hypothetical protein
MIVLGTIFFPQGLVAPELLQKLGRLGRGFARQRKQGV